MRIIIISGAGISQESGLPTFRDSNGLWENFKIEEVANIYTWKENAEKVHRFYNQRREDLKKVFPNKAHEKIASWEQQWNVDLFSQNIDDLLEKAGCQKVIKLHGNLKEMQCTACGNTWEIGYGRVEAGIDTCPKEKCRSKRGVKPNVVFFGEIAPEYAKLHKSLREARKEDFLIVLGTSGVV